MALHLCYCFLSKNKNKNPQLIICFPYFLLWSGGDNASENSIFIFFFFPLDHFHGSTGGSLYGDVDRRLMM